MEDGGEMVGLLCLGVIWRNDEEAEGNGKMGKLQRESRVGLFFEFCYSVKQEQRQYIKCQKAKCTKYLGSKAGTERNGTHAWTGKL